MIKRKFVLPIFIRRYNINPWNHAKKIHSTKFVSDKNQAIATAERMVQEKWEQKMKFWMRTYEDLFGITKLSELHSKVLDVQDKIQNVQEKRRRVQEEIFTVQKKLQESQDVLHKTSLGDDMYISLVTQVRDLLKEQRRLQDVFNLHDKTERELQMTSALSINSSQDHERTYREKNKYLSLITGVVGAILGLLGSTINNWRHRKDIKLFANDISKQVQSLQQQINSSPSSLPLDTKYDDASKKSEDFLNKLKSQEETFIKRVEYLESLLSNKILINSEMQNETLLDLQMKQTLYNLEENLDSKLKLHTTINVGVLTTLFLLGSFLLYINNSG